MHCGFCSSVGKRVQGDIQVEHVSSDVLSAQEEAMNMTPGDTGCLPLVPGDWYPRLACGGTTAHMRALEPHKGSM